MRAVRAQPPTETGELDGLAWARFAPDRAHPPAATAGVVILHGADSRKESHFDFARACAAGGLAALAFDARGHGDSAGPLDGRALDDVARMADLLRARAGVEQIGLRGSSMGGYLALAAAAGTGAAAVVAICPASATGLAVAVRAGRFAFPVDRAAVLALLANHDETAAAAALGVPLLLLHAEGDEVVPVELSRAVHAAAPRSKLVVVPGGHHRSIQHDAELQGVAVRFLVRSMRRS
ncbi:MAG TPA: alpha/beta hydrolase [Baekduia sp.]|nr:alpha/beta hydrolase [Baekduia sp.]